MRTVNPLVCSDWDAQIAKLPGASFPHSALWAAVLQRTYGFQPVCFATQPGPGPASVISMMEVNSLFTGRRGISLPFTDHCEPLGFRNGSLAKAVAEVLTHGRSRGWRYAEFRGISGGAFPDCPPASLAFYGHRLSLLSDRATLLARMTPSCRRAVRKSERSGLEIEFARTPEAIRSYYALHCLTRKQHGIPPQSFEFFRAVQEQVLARDGGVVVSARHQGRTIAAAIFFRFGGEAIYKFGASDRHFQDLRGNNFVMWEAIKHFSAQGMAVLDFGRTSVTNAGLRRFKLGWGTDERLIEYYKYDLRKNAVVSVRDNTNSWKTRLFHLIPTPLARLVGAILYKHTA